MDAVIVYLTRVKLITKLKRSLAMLQRNLLNRFPRPVIVYHEGDFNKKQQQRLAGVCPTLQFREVDISPPSWIDRSKRRQWAMRNFRGGNVGYRNMCRFFALGVYPLLEEFDYYMRLDDDSYIQSPFKDDPFEVMEQAGKVYGYRCMIGEAHKAVVGLQEFLAQHDPATTIPWNFKIYYNNFHIAKPSLWLSPPYSAALEAIDKHGGIYTQRWGDAPIQTLLVQRYVAPAQRHHFTGFKYTHGKHTWPAGR